MAPVVLALKKANIPYMLVSTGQHMELVDTALKYFKLKPNVNFKLMTDGQHPVEFMAKAMSKLYKLFAKTKPQAVLAQGDTSTVAATAVVCFNMKIPFGHVEAGLRTGDIYNPWPEEWNRRVAALGASWHFAPTKMAENKLNLEHVPGQIFQTGNTIVDALSYIMKVKPIQLDLPDVPSRPYILLTCHRRENFGAPLQRIFGAVARWAMDNPATDIVYPVHPNPQVKDTANIAFSGIPNIRLVEPMDYVSFIHCMAGAQLVVSDSGGVQEEAPSLGRRVVILRDVTERLEGVMAGYCCLAGSNSTRIRQAIDTFISLKPLPNIINPYGDGQAAHRIVDVLRQALDIGGEI